MRAIPVWIYLLYHIEAKIAFINLIFLYITPNHAVSSEKLQKKIMLRRDGHAVTLWRDIPFLYVPDMLVIPSLFYTSNRYIWDNLYAFHRIIVHFHSVKKLFWFFTLRRDANSKSCKFGKPYEKQHNLC